VTGHRVLSAIRIAMVGIVLIPVAVSLQMPSLGKLIVRSNPNRARISINDRPMGQVTDAAFVVAPGTYRVSVSGSANCGANSVTLKSGESKTLFCSNGAWTVQ
jgi:hypothetical protein